MSAIVGGPISAADPTGFAPGSNGARVLGAVVTCASRWGMSKTTVDDVAREAGLSRATVYRLFPGGKPEMVATATRTEVVGALAELRAEVERADTLREAVIVMLCGGSGILAAHPALTYMREHQPASVRAFLSFERLDVLYAAAADVLSLSLCRFLQPATARDAVVWIARIVVSHFLNPDPSALLAERAVATHVAETFVMPGLAREPGISPSTSN